jgi:ribose transport system permease protein
MRGNPGNILSGVLLALAVSALIGLVNGLIVTGLKVHGFIATLGVGLIVKGYLDTFYKGSSGSVPAGIPVHRGHRNRPGSDFDHHHARARGAGLPVPQEDPHRTPDLRGRRQPRGVPAFGHPYLAADRRQPMSSVPSPPGMAGLLLASRLGVGSPTVGSQGGYDLLSIAAVVLGGTLLAGGRGSIWGTIGGVAIFAVLDSVMSVMQVNPFLKDVVRGVVIVAAVAIYTGRAMEKRRARFDNKSEPAKPTTTAEVAQ